MAACESKVIFKCRGKKVWLLTVLSFELCPEEIVRMTSHQDEFGPLDADIMSTRSK